MDQSKVNVICYKNYNNYFNRIIKNNDDLVGFNDEAEDSQAFTNINFNPNDDVSTELILNWPNSWAPDYLTIWSSETIPTLISRWFVLETQRTRGNQYRMQLRRDVIADFRTSILKAPCFIEKATVSINNPFIVNSENMLLNQIKISESLLKDETGVGWIVGYVSRPKAEDQDIPIVSNFLQKYDYNLTEYPYATLSISDTTNINTINATRIETWHQIGSSYAYAVKYLISLLSNGDINNSNFINEAIPTLTYCKTLGNPDVDLFRYNINNAYFTKQSDILDALANFQNALNLTNNSAFINTNGKVIRDAATNQFYRINISVGKKTTKQNRLTGAGNQAGIFTMLNSMYELAVNNYNLSPATPELITFQQQAYIELTTEEQEYSINLVPLPNHEVSTKISVARNHLQDAPYDMFCIPYGEITIVSNETIKTSKAIAQAIAQEIGAQGSTTWLYDMQLLPFCPIRGITNEVNLSTLTASEDYDFITETENDVSKNVGVIFWCTESSGEFNIPFTIPVNDPKVESNTDMWRICSPNYNGIFEFNAARNGGVSFFNVDFTYKPFNPYIHVNPNFNFLYGQDFDDARGLICGGDFSIAVVSDRWAAYEVQNKNYQNIFDRGIKNLEFTQTQETVNSVFNAVGGTIQGAGMGALVGGIPGAIVGGVMGAVGGAADIGMTAGRHKEQKSYQTDLFNMQLGNIKALPDGLTKTSAIVKNNKIFPFLEYYSCTEKEKEAFKNKIKYNGMTVGAIGTIEEYIQPERTFIQGQIIRLENLSAETHVANAIYDEIKKGVYI